MAAREGSRPIPAVSPAVIAAMAALLAGGLVGVVRRYALRRALLDVPTERSSHAVPTPRGGGLGLVAAALAVAICVLVLERRGSWPMTAALVGVVAVAAIGWRDDHASLPVAPRMTMHVLAGLAVAWLALGVPGPFGVLGVAGASWWVFWTVSSINVTNFMDGIDGLIGLQAVVLGFHVVLLTGSGSAALFGAAVAGAAAGFLAWNWAPALIFLGDVGSAALGVLFVMTGVLAQRESGLPTALVFLPLFPLFLDSTATLARRWRRGERLTEAHRDHLYQRLANGGWGHARVSLLYGVAALAAVVVTKVADGEMRHPAIPSYFAAILLVGFLLARREAMVATRTRR